MGSKVGERKGRRMGSLVCAKRGEVEVEMVVVVVESIVWWLQV